MQTNNSYFEIADGAFFAPNEVKGVGKEDDDTVGFPLYSLVQHEAAIVVSTAVSMDSSIQLFGRRI